jgi:pyruvate dehydrogenase E1 component alpha subunit
MHRVIGEESFADAAVNAERARELLADMILARAFDERALALQRRGWMSGYPPFRGQEASQVGAAHAMADDDWLFPTYRANAMQIARGVPMSDLFLFRRGHPEFTSDHDVPVFPQAIPIATQIPHAVGAGMAADYRGDDLATVAYFGDGATSEGDFHEAANFAGVFAAPVVFFCENNGWAISMAADRQTAAPSIAAKADAYGFTGEQVDGNDPLAVYESVSAALETAREGSPVLVESLTYRQGAHTTSDDPSRYREDPGLPDWRTRDPIDRVAEYLRSADVIDDEFVENARARADAQVEAAVGEAEETPEPAPDDVFEYAYASASPRLEAQRADMHARIEAEEAVGTEDERPADDG